MKLLRNVLSGRAWRGRSHSSQPSAQLLAAARGHVEKGDWASAQLACEEALRIEPEHAAAMELLAVIAYRMRDWDTALELVEKSLRLDPLNGSAHANQGAMLIYMGRAREGAAACRRALVRIWPTLAPISCSCCRSSTKRARASCAPSTKRGLQCTQRVLVMGWTPPGLVFRHHRASWPHVVWGVSTQPKGSPR